MKKKKSKSRRKNVKYPALDPIYNLKTRQEHYEDVFNYADKLNEEEKDYLNRFMEEYVNADFQHEGKRVHPKRIKKTKYKTRRGKKTIDKYKKDAEDRNNARNRCLLTTARAFGGVDYLQGGDGLDEYEQHIYTDFEDMVLNKIEMGEDLEAVIQTVKDIPERELRRLGFTEKDRDSLRKVLLDFQKQKNKKRLR